MMMAQPGGGGRGGEEAVEGGRPHRQHQHQRRTNDRDEAWRRWAVLVATVWIQALTGTNFDFSAYSSALKSSLGVSQEAVNYLATASDLGKALGWSSGLALLYMPLHAVLMITATMGLDVKYQQPSIHLYMMDLKAPLVPEIEATDNGNEEEEVVSNPGEDEDPGVKSESCSSSSPETKSGGLDDWEIRRCGAMAARLLKDVKL